MGIYRVISRRPQAIAQMPRSIALIHYLIPRLIIAGRARAPPRRLAPEAGSLMQRARAVVGKAMITAIEEMLHIATRCLRIADDACARHRDDEIMPFTLLRVSNANFI